MPGQEVGKEGSGAKGQKPSDETFSDAFSRYESSPASSVLKVRRTVSLFRGRQPNNPPSCFGGHIMNSGASQSLWSDYH